MSLPPGDEGVATQPITQNEQDARPEFTQLFSSRPRLAISTSCLTTAEQQYKAASDNKFKAKIDTISCQCGWNDDEECMAGKKSVL
jgi:hypothetical protein